MLPIFSVHRDINEGLGDASGDRIFGYVRYLFCPVTSKVIQLRTIFHILWLFPHQIRAEKQFLAPGILLTLF